MPIYPSADQIQTLLAGPPDSPVVMVNLLTFKPRADAPDVGLSGADAYQKYGTAMRAFIESHGARVLFSGRVDSTVIGETDCGFQAIALVEYPSRKKFVEIAQSAEVREIGVHRAAGLESQWLIATTQGAL
jgi:uncharacterized protein (DUF1330 family)